MQRRKTLDIEHMIFGKIPPHARELEDAILGAIMLEKHAFALVKDILFPESFYINANQKIFSAMMKLDQSYTPIDMLTVVEQLRSEELLDIVGGAYYISQLTNAVVSSANIESHARIVTQCFLKRYLISGAGELISQAYEHGVDFYDIIKRMQEINDTVSNRYIPKQPSFESIVTKTVNNILGRELNANIGVRSGFFSLDAIIDAFIKGQFYVIAARPSMGKCQGADTHIVMFDGTIKKAKDIVVGDVLMGADSTPRNVLSICTGEENMYWVHQKRGISYSVNESHILSLKRSRNEWNKKHGEVVNISVRDWLKKSDKFKNNFKGYKTAVEFKDQPILIDPYFLGLWLGDGTSSKLEITNPDKEIINFIYDFAKNNGLDIRRGGEISDGTYKYFIGNCKHSFKTNPNNTVVNNGLKKRKKSSELLRNFRHYDLINNKHIPHCYIANTRKKRLELLAGLLDTDGHYQSKFQCFEITQTDKKLAEQIKFLCDSLGFMTSIKSKIATIKSIGFKGEVFRIRISGKLHEIPTRVERKKARVSTNRRDQILSTINVEFDKFGEYYGFELDGDHLYCLEDFTVTHNTAFMIQLVENITKMLKDELETLITNRELLIEENVGLGNPKPAPPVPVQDNIGIIEMETYDEAWVQRMLANKSGINSRWMKTGNLTTSQREDIIYAGQYLMGKGIICDFNPVSTISQIRAKAKSWKAKYNIKALIIDYLQYVEADDIRLPRERQVSTISKGLAVLAKELDIPVIAFAQLSREVHKRADKRPMLSDLRESGSIEQDARCIMFLHRPEYYGELEDPITNESTKDITEVIVAKNNEGETGKISLKMIKEFSKFEEIPTEFFTANGTATVVATQGELGEVFKQIPNWE